MLSIILIALLVVILWTWSTRTIPVKVAGRTYNVVGRYQNREKAAQIFSELHARMVTLMTHLKRKYIGGVSHTLDFSGNAGASDEDAPIQQKKNEESEDLANITLSIIRNYDPDVFYENDPATSAETAYTLNKGSAMYFCIRDKELHEKFCDFNILLFAMLHEVSHIGTYDDWGHRVRFWEVFKFILQEAVECGAYIPVDYSKSPKIYCGLEVAYNPLFDGTLRDLRPHAVL